MFELIKLKREIPFVKYKGLFFAISVAINIFAIVLFVTKGLNYGIDFKGGVKLTYQFAEPTSDGAIQGALSSAGIDATVQRLGEKTDNRFTIKAKLSETSSEETINNINGAIEGKFGSAHVTLEGQEAVGPKVGKELRKKGMLAILFSIIAMLIYIGWRFDFFFAPGAIASLVHDVLVVVAFIILFNKEYDLTLLAAILTIVGYSVNDTIVIFDRIREHANKITANTVESVVNTSINETLSRTIITGLSTLFVVSILFIMGGGTIHNFAFCFMIGIITGTYSSIFIASPVYIWLYRYWPKLVRR